MKHFKQTIRFILFITILTAFVSNADALSNRTLYKRIQKLDDDISEKMPIPVVFSVGVNDLDDTWGAARSGGRSHEGIDIFAPRGALIASPTEAVVTKIADKGLGGKQVWTANPGDESFYYAHLNGVYPGLEVGDILDIGDPIGFVGNTGNASGGSPHLHLGIYTRDGAINPYERFTKEFSTKDRINVLKDYIEYLQDEIKKIQRKNR